MVKKMLPARQHCGGNIVYHILLRVATACIGYMHIAFIRVKKNA